MMRKRIWHGAAVALMTGGMCWTVAQFQQCPRCPVARLLRSVMGCTRSADSTACSSQRTPVIVDLSAPWLKDPSALFPEDNLQLEDVLPSRERSKQLDLIDLSLLSEAANPARPNYEEEEAAAGLTEEIGVGTRPDCDIRPEAASPRTAEESGSRRYMPYAEENLDGVPPERSEAAKHHEAVHLEEPPLAPEQKDSPAMPKATESPSTPGSDRGADARPARVKYHVTLKKSIPAEDDARPTHPEVDTMEFRPTDAGAVDFLHRRQIY